MSDASKRELTALRQEIKRMKERVELSRDVVELGVALDAADRASLAYQTALRIASGSNLALAQGIEWSKETAEIFEEIGDLVDHLPLGPLKDFMVKALKSVPGFVDALTRRVRERIEAIDRAARGGTGTVVYREDEIVCENAGFMNQGTVDMIKALKLAEHERVEVFKAACMNFSGLEKALRDLGHLP